MFFQNFIFIYIYNIVIYIIFVYQSHYMGHLYHFMIHFKLMINKLFSSGQRILLFLLLHSYSIGF